MSRWPGALGIALIGAGILAGCLTSKGGQSSGGGAKPKPKPGIFIIGFDRSESTRAMRKSQRLLVGEIFAQVADRAEGLEIWAMDQEPVPVFETRTVDEEVLPPGVFKQLDPVKAPPKGTRPALFWEEVVARHGESDRPVRVAVLTDGGNDYAADEKRIDAALTRLARNPRVSVIMLGLLPVHRRGLTTRLRPFGDRGRTASTAEEGLRTLESWLHEVEQAERNGGGGK